MDDISITPGDIAYRKLVGKSGKSKVFELRTTGGLNVIVKAMEGGRTKFLGVGSHRLIARHIAKKNDETLEWTELSKGDYLDPKDWEHLVPYYDELTNQFQELHGDRDE